MARGAREGLLAGALDRGAGDPHPLAAPGRPVSRLNDARARSSLQSGPTAGQELTTSQAVIAAAELVDLGPYYDLRPHGGAGIGFTVLRRYPAGTPVAEVVNGRGEPAFACAVGLRVAPRDPAEARWQHVLVWTARSNPHTRDHGPGFRPDCPECPTPAALDRFNRSPRLTDLDFDRQFRYEVASGRFFGPKGVMSARQILDHAYDFHVRTVRRSFRLRRWFRNFRWHVAWSAFSGMQAVCVFLLKNLYSVRAQVPPEKRLPDPHHAFSAKDFVEDQEPSTAVTFQGVLISRPRLLWNLCVLGALGGVFYYNMNLDHHSWP